MYIVFLSLLWEVTTILVYSQTLLIITMLLNYFTFYYVILS